MHGTEINNRRASQQVCLHTSAIIVNIVLGKGGKAMVFISHVNVSFRSHGAKYHQHCLVGFRGSDGFRFFLQHAI